jgi:ribose 5-phosphate isomerase B
MAYRVALGADHGGVDLKADLAAYLNSRGHTVKDFGAFTKESCDYPVYSFVTAEAVSRGDFQFGVLVCRSGIGMAMCANKVPGIRAACCENTTQARLSREHNNANVLVLAGDFIEATSAHKILDVFLEAKFEGGRHERRIKLIDDYDAKRTSGFTKIKRS